MGAIPSAESSRARPSAERSAGRSAERAESEASGSTLLRVQQLRESRRWIRTQSARGVLGVLVAIPLLTLTWGVFPPALFALWTSAALIWAAGAALVIIALPVYESRSHVSHAMYHALTEFELHESMSDLLTEMDYDVRDSDPGHSARGARAGGAGGRSTEDAIAELGWGEHAPHQTHGEGAASRSAAAAEDASLR